MIIIMQLLLTFNCKNQTKSKLIKLCVTVGVTPALVTHVSHKITEGKVTFYLLVPCHLHPPCLRMDKLHFPLLQHTPLTLEEQSPSCYHPPGNGRTCYISPPATTFLVTEGHVIFPLLLPHPSPDYRRTSYISPPAICYHPTLHFSSCCKIP